MWISINPKIAVIDFAVQNMNRILKAHKAGAVEGRDASIFAIKKHPLGESQLINFCHQTPGRRFVFDLKNSNLGFFNSLLFFFNPEVPALGEPTPESPSAGDASGTESPARRRAAHASLRAVGAAAPGVEGLRKGRPRRFRCWKPRLRTDVRSCCCGMEKKPRELAEDVWRNAVDWVQLCGFVSMFLWVVGSMVF